MTYSNGPYGQGFPGQYGYPQQPYGMPPAPPGGVTGIVAGVLAGLGGLANVVGGLAMAYGVSLLIGGSSDVASSAAGVGTALIAMTALNIVAGLLLLVGTVTLLLRKMIGRWLVAAGCSTSTVSGLISLALPVLVADFWYQSTARDVVALIFPTVTLVLVLLPSTAAWIQAKQSLVMTTNVGQFLLS